MDRSFVIAQISRLQLLRSLNAQVKLLGLELGLGGAAPLQGSMIPR